MGDAARVAFRTDAGSAVGLGHLSRCLALAHALRTLGAESRVLIDGDHRALELALAAGLEAPAVARADDPEATLELFGRLGASALVVDSYGFTPDDLAVFVAAGRPVAVFDDTANRELPVDLVINGGVGSRALPYRGGPRTRYLLGPSYLALRPEFAEAAPRAIHDDVRRALVTIGGAAPGRLVAPLLRWAIARLGAITLHAGPGPRGHAGRARRRSRAARRHEPTRSGPRGRSGGAAGGPGTAGSDRAAPMRLGPAGSWLRRVLGAGSVEHGAAASPDAPVARVAFNMRPTSSPWGGGNQWLVQMVRSLSARGWAVSDNLDGVLDAIVIVDPRVGGLVTFGPEDIRDYRRRSPRVVCLHRINECDARKATTMMDGLLAEANVA